ncbi:MAG: hypothetical protein WBB85_01005 [Albidovulum sp.]|uniref:hypothetical protein n=1 Tax=Albidovulum sp. TaxID=1872424 RepID=UPI003CAA58BF
MKQTASLLCAALLCACVPTFPQSASEMRSMTASRSALTASNSIAVASNMATTRTVLSRMSRNCYNRIVDDNHVYRVGAYGPQSILMRYSYRSTVSTSGGVTTLTIRKKHLSGINPGQPENGFIGFVLDARANDSGGLTLTGHGSGLGLKGTLRDFKKSIETGKIECTGV